MEAIGEPTPDASTTSSRPSRSAIEQALMEAMKQPSPEPQTQPEEHYLSLSPTLGINFKNYTDYETALDMATASLLPLDPDIGTITPPTELKHATTIAQNLIGYSATFMVQKAYMESSLGTQMGDPDGFVYGIYQLSNDAVTEGIQQLMKMPANEEIVRLVPEIGLLANGGLDTATETELRDFVRTDPLASTLIAGGYNIRYTNAYADELKPIHSYLVHYLGPGNFKSFMEASEENPDTIAYEALRDGIKSPVLNHAANVAIFFDTDTNGEKTPRTLQEVKDFLISEKGLGNHIIYTEVTPEDLDNFEILTDDAAKAEYEKGFDNASLTTHHNLDTQPT